MDKLKPLFMVISGTALVLLTMIHPQFATVLLVIIVGAIMFLLAAMSGTHQLLNNMLASLTLVLSALTGFVALTALFGLLAAGLVGALAGLALTCLAIFLVWRSLAVVPPRTRIIIVGMFGRREYVGYDRMMPPIPVLERVIYVTTHNPQRCAFQIDNVNLPQLPLHSDRENRKTGPPEIDYRSPEYNIAEIAGDLRFRVRADAVAHRFNIPDYDTIWRQAMKQEQPRGALNIGALAQATSDIYRTVLREELDEIVRRVVIQHQAESPLAISNRRIWYARIALSELARRVDDYGIDIPECEFRSVKLVSDEIEQQHRQAMAQAYSKSQELRMVGEAWYGVQEEAVERMVQALQRMDIEVAPQRLDTMIRDAMREAFYHRYGSHAYYFSTLANQQHRPHDDDDYAAASSPFRRVS